MMPGQPGPTYSAPDKPLPGGQPETVSKPRGPLPSQALLQGQKSVSIDHQGEIYRLQITRQGKLILTK